MSYVSTHSVMGIGVFFLISSIVSLSSRFYVRISRKQILGPDDWLSIPAMALVVAEASIMIAGSATNSVGAHSPEGLGLGFVDFINAQQRTISYLETSFDLIQIVALAFIKLSILFFYRRIFRGKFFNYLSWGLAGFIIVCAISFFIAIIAACGTDIDANFETILTLKEKCVDTFVILISFSVFDAAQDLALLIIPIPFVLGLHMPLRRKFAVLGVLLVGTLAIACSFTRMILWGEILGPQLLTNPTVGGVPSDDDIGVVSLLMFWSMLELGIAMIASCLPILRPLFNNFSPESVINSVRSALSLHSLGSRNKSFPGTKGGSYQRSESETAIAGIAGNSASASQKNVKNDWNPLGTTDTIDVEAYAMGKVSGNAQDGITRETEITQTFQKA